MRDPNIPNEKTAMPKNYIQYLITLPSKSTQQIVLLPLYLIFSILSNCICQPHFTPNLLFINTQVFHSLPPIHEKRLFLQNSSLRFSNHSPLVEIFSKSENH